ncbi:MAG: hypothetical protein ACRD07_05415 [Acidimicrobiales bacterium]
MHARHLGHLVRRFFGSLRPGGPSPADDAWAVGRMTPGEAGLWGRMSLPDRRHAVVVARRVDAALGPAATRPVLAAALLHDVGKIESGFGPVRRAAATVAGMVGGHDAARRWRGREGLVGRVGRYLCHDEIGAGLLGAAGSDALTISWAREHHLPPERWTIAAEVGAALKAADDD